MVFFEFDPRYPLLHGGQFTFFGTLRRGFFAREALIEGGLRSSRGSFYVAERY